MLELNYPLCCVRQALVMVKKRKKAKMHKRTRSEALGSSAFPGTHLRTNSHGMWAYLVPLGIAYKHTYFNQMQKYSLYT